MSSRHFEHDSVISGIGQSAVGRRLGRSAIDLTVESALAAIEDAGLRREWQEEVVYEGDIAYRLIGAINDQTTPVGRVHVGLIFLVEGDRPEIAIREVDKLAGTLLPLDAMRSYYLDMESWSQLIFDYLTRVRVG